MNRLIPHRPIRSYVRRQGRLTARQQEALKKESAHFVLPLVPIDSWETVFGHDAATVLEIGFGMGHVLLDLARCSPEKNFIGIDVYTPGVGTVLAQLAAEGINNVRLFCADVVAVLPLLPHESLQDVLIFFPDPWPKTRHHKRRLIQKSFIELLKTKLQKGACIHLATDWGDYAKHMMRTLGNIEGLREIPADPQMRPLTKYEQRGQRLGHQVWDFAFKKL
jgi:tRNA (guanine-N7-)-methyltransferase